MQFGSKHHRIVDKDGSQNLMILGFYMMMQREPALVGTGGGHPSHGLLPHAEILAACARKFPAPKGRAPSRRDAARLVGGGLERSAKAVVADRSR